MHVVDRQWRLGDIDNTTDDVAAVLNRLGGAHIPTIPKAKRFADRQAQSLILSSLLLIDFSLRRLLSRSLIASQRIPEMTITSSESLGGLHRSPPGIQTIDRENDPSKLEIFFGPFRLLQARRLLLKGNEPVSLSGRAFDLVIALVERPGEVVSKSELIAKVWPQTFVAEGNLKVRIAALRRVLAGGQPGDRYISTIVGRGYCLSRRSLGRVAEARALPRRSGSWSAPQSSSTNSTCNMSMSLLWSTSAGGPIEGAPFATGEILHVDGGQSAGH